MLERCYHFVRALSILADGFCPDFDGGDTFTARSAIGQRPQCGRSYPAQELPTGIVTSATAMLGNSSGERPGGPATAQTRQRKAESTGAFANPKPSLPLGSYLPVDAMLEESKFGKAESNGQAYEK